MDKCDDCVIGIGVDSIDMEVYFVLASDHAPGSFEHFNFCPDCGHCNVPSASEIN